MDGFENFCAYCGVPIPLDVVACDACDEKQQSGEQMPVQDYGPGLGVLEWMDDQTPSLLASK
ncbi:hypothetical protein ACQZV8_04730 [Magnetococcales bacterium HHB-1]